jgi:hypothetical protein
MRVARRLGALLVLLAVGAPAPPEPIEDRSVPGYCSPDCPLQQAAHAVAIAAAPPPRLAGDALVGRAVRGPRLAAAPSTALSPDAPRAPPVRPLALGSRG